MKLSFSILLIIWVFPTFSQTIQVEISGIKNNKGVIKLNVYNNNESFEAEKPVGVFNFVKEKMDNGILKVEINDLNKGTYGIVLIDDENSNGKIDFKFFVPTEGFGFSNYYFKGSRKPHFDSFSFKLMEGTTNVKIKVQYY